MVGGVRVKVYHKVDIDFGVFSEVLEVLEKFFEVVGFRHAPCRRCRTVRGCALLQQLILVCRIDDFECTSTTTEKKTRPSTAQTPVHSTNLTIEVKAAESVQKQVHNCPKIRRPSGLSMGTMMKVMCLHTSWPDGRC